MFWVASFLATAILVGDCVSASAPVQAYSNYLGYYPDSKYSTWSPVNCQVGSTYVRSSTYGTCCSDIRDGCDFVTNCDMSTLYITGAVNTTRICPTGQSCHIMSIFESAPVTTDSPVIDIFCYGDKWSATEIFQMTTTDTNTATASPGTYATAPGANPTSTPPDATEGSESSGSKGWIAGVVVGPVAGRAIFAALAFWYIRGYRAKEQANRKDRELSTSTAAERQFGNVSELHGTHKPYELDGSTSRFELPANSRPELPADCILELAAPTDKKD